MHIFTFQFHSCIAWRSLISRSPPRGEGWKNSPTAIPDSLKKRRKGTLREVEARGLVSVISLPYCLPCMDRRLTFNHLRAYFLQVRCLIIETQRKPWPSHHVRLGWTRSGQPFMDTWLCVVMAKLCTVTTWMLSCLSYICQPNYRHHQIDFEENHFFFSLYMSPIYKHCRVINFPEWWTSAHHGLTWFIDFSE